VLLGVIGVILITAFKLYIPFLQGKKAFGLSSQYIIIGNLIPSLLLLAAIYYTDSIIILIATYFISHTIINFILLKKTLALASNEQTDPSIYNHSKHTTFQDLILETSGHIDKIMLFQFGSAATLASYVFATNIPRQFQMLFKSAKSIALPKLATASYHDLRATLLRKVLSLYIVIIPVTVLYILCAPFIFSYVFPQYVDAAIYSQVYALIFLLLPIRVIKDAMLGHDKMEALYKMTIITSLCKVGASIILIPLFGIWGVLTSLLVMQFIYSVLTVWYFLKSNDTSIQPDLTETENHLIA
jgi:O-antigen/teichoic acid export membrane protein